MTTDHTDLCKRLRHGFADENYSGKVDSIMEEAADAIATLREQVAAITEERKDWALRFKLNDVTPWEWMTRANRAESENAAIRTLMDSYNIGGWTDALGPMQRALAAEADNAALRQTIESAHKVMHGDGVMDQGQAWDECVRLLDAAMLAGKKP